MNQRKALMPCTFDELIDYFGQRHDPIKSPFTPNERSLAQTASQQTLLVKSRQSIPNAMGVHVTRDIASVS